jgi:hypothetical protein
MPYWAIQLQSKRATQGTGVDLTELLAKNNLAVLQQLKTTSLSPETPSMIYKVDEEILMKSS